MDEYEDRLMTRKELSIKLQVSQRLISNWESKGLPVMYIGDLPRYKYDEVVGWMKKNADVKTEGSSV